MSKSIILELRQEDSTINPLLVDGKTQNGDYEVILDNPQMLYAGDQVQVKAVYLDTAQSGAGTIHIQNDTPCSFEFCYYQENYNLDQTYDYQQGTGGAGSPALGVQALREYTNLDWNTATAPETNFRGDNNKWWLAKRHQKGASETYLHVSGLNVIPIINSKGYAYFGGTVFHFKYTPITPNAAKLSASCQVHIGNHLRYNYEQFNPYKELDIFCLPKEGSTTEPDIVLVSGWTPGSKIASYNFNKIDTVGGTDSFFTPQTGIVNFTIKQGDYTAPEFTQTINDLLTNAQLDGYATDDIYAASTVPAGNKGWSVMNPLLTSVLKNANDLYLESKAFNPGGDGSDIKQCFVNASNPIVEYTNIGTGVKSTLDYAGKHYYEYALGRMRDERAEAARPPLDRYIGTNQFALTLDPAENKIKIDLAHFPIYGNSSSKPATTGTDPTPYVRINDAVPCLIYNQAIEGMIGATPDFAVDKGLVLRYGGIALTAMTPTSLWFDTLGFNNAIINPKQDAIAVVNKGDTPGTTPNSFTIREANDGEHCTGAFPGLDIGVQHHEDYYSQPIYNNFAGEGQATVISVSDTTSIFASRVYNTIIADEGYFKLNIASNFQQEMVSSGLTTSTTQSIVNRYYTANSFTSDQGAGAIVYTHRGEPQMLSNFKIQVLNPDNSFVNPTILAEKNSVFVEIVKPFPQPNPTK